MHPMTLYRKVRDDLTLTNTEYNMLMAHEDMLPARRSSLSKNPFLNRCAGSQPAPGLAIGESARLILDKKIDSCRRDFMAMMAEGIISADYYLLGARFYSDDTVFTRIRGAAQIEEFFANPYGWIMDGLRDCAGADYHYFFEKEY